MLVLCLLASGTAGCLLYTDPINAAPSVTITPGPDPTPQFVRSLDAQFTAIASDADQSTDPLTFDWYQYQDKTCENLPPGPPTDPNRGPVWTIPLTTLGPGCVAVVVTDKHGATASATRKYDVVNQAPVANIEIQPAAGMLKPVPGQPYPIPLYSKITLSGANSYDPDDRKPTPIWHVFSADSTEVLVPGCPDNSKGPSFCTFSTSTPGTYQVQLVVSDDYTTSAAEQVIQVDVDQLPNILLDSAQPLPPTSPNDPPLLLLADRVNAFTINRVEDDGDPYPPSDPLAQAASTAGFVWFWRHYPADISFQRWIGSGPTFTIGPDWFEPQNTIQVRVEYHDRVTACQPRTPGCDAAFAACDPNATICYAPYRRVEWVTWTVTFR